MNKVIGNTVGMGLPKPNLLQTDPKKGDYVNGKSAIPTKVSQLENDKKYLTEHQDISGKLDADKLPEAINTALAQAKASGEFDGPSGTDGSNGKDGKDGTSVTVASVTESAADGGSNIVTFSDGKTLTVKNGKTGADGKTPVKGTDYYTAADKADMVNAVLAALPVYNGEVV